MKIGYLDCFAGMSSSRFMGALVDAGVPQEILYDALRALDVGARLDLMRIKRNDIQTTKAHISLASVDIDMDPIPYYELPIFVDQQSDPKDLQLLSTIIALISNTNLSEKAKALAIDCFTLLAMAEAQVRALPIEEIYFHKIRAINTVVTVTLCCVGCDWLQIDQWYVSPLNVGSGMLRYPQGSLPVPTPATLQLLGNAPIISSGPQKELLTSTCAALLKALKVSYEPCPPLCIDQVGYGAGRIEYDNLPNFLRICIGHVAKLNKQNIDNNVVITQAEFTDLKSEQIEILQQELYQKGAQLIYLMPIFSKENQVTHKLVIVSLPQYATDIRYHLFSQIALHTVHWRAEHYESLIHYNDHVMTPWGEIGIRIGKLLDNKIISVIPDETACQSVAQKHGLPVEQISKTVKRLFLTGKNLYYQE